MQLSIAQERVKPCLRCDTIIPYASVDCPSCNSNLQQEAVNLCNGCTTPLEADTVYCPSCGELALSVGRVPFHEENKNFNLSKRDSSPEFLITCFKSITIFAFFWVVIEHMVL